MSGLWCPIRALSLIHILTLWSSFFGLTYAVLFWLGPKLIEAAGAGALFQAHAAWMLGCAGLLAVLMPADRREARRTGQGGLLAQHVAIYASPFMAAPALSLIHT